MYFLWFILLQVTTILGQDDDVTRLVDLINDSACQASSYQVRTDDSDFIGSSIENATADYGEFDFIIVGSGAAGAALASKLTESGKWIVLLLEAGAHTNELSFIPYYNGLQTLSDRNWGYTTTPQDNACLARNNNQCPIIRGKTLGGTTIFTTLYSRAGRQDYNNWAAGGNPGWSYTDLLPYMKSVENFTINANSRYHGFSGPITISSVAPVSPLDDVVLRGFENIGITRNEDYNGGQVAGASSIQFSLKNGNETSAIEYIRQANDRPNFNITLNALVTKILIYEQNKKVYGVTFIRDKITYRATVRKEVILSAGPFNTPKLLMLSGVGPRTELENNGIKVIKSLPVGIGLKTQIFLTFFATSNYTEPPRNLRDLVQDYLNGEGLLTVEGNERIIAFFRANGSLKGNPNLAIVVSYPTPLEPPISFTNFRDVPMVEVNYTKTFGISVFLDKPISNGNVTLKSNNINDFPNINPNMFKNSRDIANLYKGIQVALRLVAELNNLGIQLTPVVPISECDSYDNTTRQYWYCVIRQLATPYDYATATVKMGPPNDLSSVLNSGLQVYDIVGLRVVDYSVVPVNSNSGGGAMGSVIGEKAADILKKTYGN